MRKCKNTYRSIGQPNHIIFAGILICKRCFCTEIHDLEMEIARLLNRGLLEAKKV